MIDTACRALFRRIFSGEILVPRAGFGKAGLWDSTSTFVATVDQGHSIEFFGQVLPYSPDDWVDQPAPTIGEENNALCIPIYSVAILVLWLTEPDDDCFDLNQNGILDLLDLVGLVNNLP